MLQPYNPQNKDLIVNINGQLIHRDQAAISPFDSVVQNGDAVWEGLRLYNGRIFKLTEHLNRLQAGGRALAFKQMPTNETLIAELKKTLAANQMHDNVHIRLTITRGVKYTSGMDPRVNQSPPTLIILAEHKTPVYEKSGLRLISSSIRRIPPDCLDQNIHSCNMINSILAKMQANNAGVDDAVMLDIHGFIAETNATHLFLVNNDVVYTPHTDSCPEGITRDTVLSLCQQHQIPFEVKNLSLSELYRADEIFCTGTMGELAMVNEVDGRIINNNQLGPRTKQLTQLYQQLTTNSGYLII